MPLIAGVTGSPWTMLPMLSLLLTIPLLNKVSAEGRDLIPVLTGTARVEMVYGILLAVGLWIS